MVFRWRIPPKIGLLVSVVAGLATVAACGDSGGAGEGIPGAYVLRSIAAQDLPFAIIDFGNGEKVEITSGGILLNVDDTCSQTINSTSTLSGTPVSETEIRDGTYTVVGTVITLTFANGEVLTGTVDGITLTLAVDQIPWTFRK